RSVVVHDHHRVPHACDCRIRRPARRQGRHRLARPDGRGTIWNVFRRGAAVAGAGVCIAAGVFTLVLVERDPDSSFSGGGVLGRLALGGAGFALAAAGLAAWLGGGHRFGPLLVAGSLAWFIPEWIGPKNPSSLAFTTGLVLYACCFPLIGHAVLAFPSGRLGAALERATV